MSTLTPFAIFANVIFMDNSVENQNQPNQPTLSPDMPSKKSFHPAITLSLFFIVILIAGIVLFARSYKKYMKSANPYSSSNNYQTSGGNIANQSQIPTITPSAADVQLNQDSQTVDNNLSSLDSDINNATQGLNDQQGDLQ